MIFDPKGNQGFGGAGDPEGSDQPPPPAYPPPPPPYGSTPTGGYQQPGGYGPPPGYGQSPGYGPPPFGSQPPYGSQPGYGTQPEYGYQSGYGYAAPKTDGTAIAALILAIASFIVCPILPAVIALSLVPSSRRAIAASGGAVQGLGILTATKIVAWINIALFVAGIGIFAIAAVVAGTTTSTTLIRPLLG